MPTPSEWHFTYKRSTIPSEESGDDVKHQYSVLEKTETVYTPTQFWLEDEVWLEIGSL